MGFDTRVPAGGPGLPTGGLEPGGGMTRRGSRRRDAWISTISTVVFLAAVVALIVLSPGVNKVVESFFSKAGFEDSFGTVSEGFWLNVKLMLLAEGLVLVVGLAIAVIRSLPGPRWRRCGSSRSSIPTCSAAFPCCSWSSWWASVCRRCSWRSSRTSRCSSTA